MTTSEGGTLTSRPGSPVYCSGPMFSRADVAQQLEIAKALEDAGFSTYVPQRDGIEVASVMGDINAPRLPPQDMANVMPVVRKLVFALDVYQLLERCAAVVFNLDGRVPDDGSVMEASVGWSAGLPVVVFKTTPITMLGGYDNPMLAGLALRWNDVTTLSELPKAVDDAVAADQALGGPAFTPGAHARNVIALGRKVWTLMPDISTVSNLKTAAEILPAVEKILEKLRPELDAAG